MPSPQELVEVVVVKGNAQALAMQERDLCVKAAARDDREMLLGLSPGGRSALHLVGGLYKPGMASEEELRWLKKEFVSVWKYTPADVKSLQQSNTSGYEQLEAVRWKALTHFISNHSNQLGVLGKAFVYQP